MEAKLEAEVLESREDDGGGYVVVDWWSLGRGPFDEVMYGPDKRREGRVGFDCFDEGTESTSASKVAVNAVGAGGSSVVYSAEIDVLVEDWGGDALSKREGSAGGNESEPLLPLFEKQVETYVKGFGD